MCENKKECKKCKNKYDPGYDFCEDVEALEAVMYFGDIEELCGSCIWELINDMQEFADKWGA